jgi:hypothetical protein
MRLGESGKATVKLSIQVKTIFSGETKGMQILKMT